MNEWFDAEHHVERAHEHYEAGRWQEAETELRQALSLNPYRPDWHFNLGLTLEQTGRFEDAATAFQKAHDLDPDAQSANCVGLNFLRADRAKEALPWFERAQKLSPEESASFVHRIEAYAQLGDHDQAEVMFYMAQQVNPKDATAYATLADSLLDRGLHDKAVWCLREAAHLDAGLPRIHARLAQAYAATGRLERARQLYLRELRQDPGDIDTLMELGCLLVDMNRLGEAGEKFRRVLELEPDNPTAHYNLADLAVRLGQHAEALAQFDVVLRLDADFVGARRQVARLLLKRDANGDANSARDMLSTELAMSREQESRFTPEDLEELGHLMLDAKMPLEARAVLEGLAAKRPANAGVLHSLAVACFQLGDRVMGLEHSREVLRLEPQHVAAMSNMAVASLHDKQWTRARYWVRQALRVEPDDAFLRRLRLRLRLHSLAEAFSWAGERVSRVFRARPKARTARRTDATP
jgi:tetratricopeptide (TPR) repeat protein